jgi:hypothetical protein
VARALPQCFAWSSIGAFSPFQASLIDRKQEALRQKYKIRCITQQASRVRQSGLKFWYLGAEGACAWVRFSLLIFRAAQK